MFCRWDSYQSIVVFKPCSSVVWAVNPISFSARVTSRQRRGWPSGLLASQMILLVKLLRRAINSVRFFMVISRPLPRFMGSGELYFSRLRTRASAQSWTYKNSRLAAPVPQAVISFWSVSRASTHFLIRAGMTWLECGWKLSFGP